MNDYEIEQKLYNLERKIEDVAYDLRRAIEDLESRLSNKSDKHHEHEGSS